jgi:hypothetical protein
MMRIPGLRRYQGRNANGYFQDLYWGSALFTGWEYCASVGAAIFRRVASPFWLSVPSGWLCTLLPLRGAGPCSRSEAARQSSGNTGTRADTP